jgi:N-acyl-D-amino-acid deacylase
MESKTSFLKRHSCPWCIHGVILLSLLFRINIGLAVQHEPESFLTKVGDDAAGPVLYDIIIENGRIIDGTGNPWYYGDIGVSGGKILKIGNLKNFKATRRIDATGMFVAPGFIDIHTHSDNRILKLPRAENSVRQGLTTIVAGNCGGSPLPVGSFLDQVRQANISINYITLVGHNTIRRQVMGSENRAPTPQELSEMKHLVEESMKEGAFGLSTGLYYTPGNFAKTDEVVELAKVAAKHGGIFTSHIRDESNYNIGLLAAISEAITVGEEANIPVQISHLKCLGKSVWHKSDQALELIHQARKKGINVAFDQYPYTASSTGLWGAVFPAWAQEGGTSKFLERLKESKTKKRIYDDMRSNISRRGGGNTLYIIKHNAFLSDLAKLWELDEVDAAIKIQSEGGSSIISFNMTDHDLENIMQSPYGMIASDGSISGIDEGGHPRSYGTFPRVLQVYVREKNLLTWEEAIRKMTSAPAIQLGLRDRGLLQQGMMADIVVFDPERVREKSSYETPAIYPEGIPYVLVNGIVVIDGETHTGASAGRVLEREN